MRSTSAASRPQLVEILFGAYRRQILGLLLLRPDETFYVREIARLTGVSAGSLHRELKLLTDAGLLLRTTAGNQVRYQADRTCPVFNELAGIFLKTAGLADVLRDVLAPLQKKISLALAHLRHPKKHMLIAQLLAEYNLGVRHYIARSKVTLGSEQSLAEAPGFGVDAEGCVDCGGWCVGGGGLAHMQSATGLGLETRGDALLCRHDFA